MKAYVPYPRKIESRIWAAWPARQRSPSESHTQSDRVTEIHFRFSQAAGKRIWGKWALQHRLPSTNCSGIIQLSLRKRWYQTRAIQPITEIVSVFSRSRQ